MLFREHIPQLVANDFGVPDHRVDVSVGVTVNPIVDAAIGTKPLWTASPEVFKIPRK